MDYEFRIQLLEKETAHLREMQRLLGEHQDITDQRLDKLQSVTTVLVDSIGELRNVANQTSADVAKMARKVDDLIEGLLREPRNGKGSV